jgi:hypothetical protein
LGSSFQGRGDSFIFFKKLIVNLVKMTDTIIEREAGIKMDYKKNFFRFEDHEGFTKGITQPVIDGAQKAALNRKGNVLYNSGNIEGAKRIFLTTGYTDGLVRIGDYYVAQGREIDALRMYWIAPDHTKSEPIIERLSAIIQTLLREEEDQPNE